MKLRDMLNEVGILVPNDIPIDVQISWMNQVQSSLYRLYGTPETSYNFTAQPSVSFYDLPANCLPERARKLVLNGKAMTFVPPEEDDDLTTAEKYWTVINKKIFISPTPATSLTATLFYLPSPTVLSLSALDAEPSFPGDFNELLILGCTVKVATAMKSDALPALLSQYDELQRKAARVLGSKNQRSVNLTRQWM